MVRAWALVVGAAVCSYYNAFAQVIDEARDVTTVDISAVKWDSKTSAQGGCGEDGCRPELAYDDDVTAESRWSCQQPYDPDSYDECALIFTFHEPQHVAEIQVDFYQGETRSRSLYIAYDLLTDDGNWERVVVGEYTSTGTTPGFEVISTEDFPNVDTKRVQEVVFVAPLRTPANQWLSISEIKLGVYAAQCEASNPNQSCEPDAVEDRLPALNYLNMDDEELWELLVNGKGIGLCNIRVAGPGEETDLYAYSGVLNDEGDHGYPGMHAGYVSTPDWPSGSPDSDAVCADYDAAFCGPNGRTNAIAHIRNAINSGHCCLSQ